MKLAEIKDILADDLPKGVKYKLLNTYNLTYMYTDGSGDDTEICLCLDGNVVTNEQPSSYGNKNGTEWTPDLLAFMWRLSRMAQDKPW